MHESCDSSIITRVKEQAEKTWPEHREQVQLCSLPNYLGKKADYGTSYPEWLQEGKKWLQEYHADIDVLLNLRQEHIHPKNKDGERIPLTSCRSKTNPKECKHGFFKTQLMDTEARILCHGLAEKKGMQTKGDTMSVKKTIVRLYM